MSLCHPFEIGSDVIALAERVAALHLVLNKVDGLAPRARCRAIHIAGKSRSPTSSRWLITLPTSS
jgi:hypothetical protein